MRKTVGIAGVAVVCLLASLLGAAAAGANGSYSDDVQLILRANGSLDIIGDNLDNRIELCDDGIFLAVFVYLDESISFAEQFVVTNDVRINMRGGSDTVNINGVACTGDPVMFPGDLRVTLGSGSDIFIAYDVTVEDNLTVLGGSGFETIRVSHATVDGGASFNTNGSGSDTTLGQNSFGRTTFRGGSSVDEISASDNDFGHNPSFYTYADGDSLSLNGNTATGRLTTNTGSGDDSLNVRLLFGMRDHDLNVIMGSGNDDTFIHGDALRSPDRLNGGSGSDDILRYHPAIEDPTINGYETVALTDPD